METPVYIALSRQSALRRQLEVVANNVANMNTPAFKSQSILFLEYLDRPARGETVSMVQDNAVLRDLREGAFTRTDNPLDVAISGDGYFVVDTAAGPRYTRAGRFQLNDERQIVDVNGLPVLDDTDRPIVIPDGAADIRIAATGDVSTELGALGRLKLVRFEREQHMTELGGGLYASDDEPLEAEEARVVQGMIEESNVQPIVEMTKLIEINRQYMSAQKLLEQEHERQRNAIAKIARVS